MMNEQSIIRMSTTSEAQYVMADAVRIRAYDRPLPVTTYTPSRVQICFVTPLLLTVSLRCWGPDVQRKSRCLGSDLHWYRVVLKMLSVLQKITAL
jgi:hypothetical protein